MSGATRQLTGNYLDLLARIHDELRPRTYLEIGMHTGRSLMLAHPETLAIGIDPTPAIRERVNSTAMLFFETSDDFFASHDVAALLGGRPLDLAFVDGLHHFEFALRDFRNIERYCGPDSTVLVHDCSPPDEASQRRERVTHLWTGDTWKIVPCLRELRPDLEITTVAVGPSGLTMIRNLDPTSRVLHDRYDEAVERFGSLDFAEYDGRLDGLLGLIRNDWDEIARVLPAGPLAEPGSAPGVRKRYPVTPRTALHQATRLAKLAARRVVPRRG